MRHCPRCFDKPAETGLSTGRDHIVISGAGISAGGVKLAPVVDVTVAAEWVPSMSETIVPFAPARKASIDTDHDPLDQAGHNVMGMLQQAATVAKENCRHALDVAHKLSMQLRAAEDRVRNLEAEVTYYQERAARAEQWLLRISRDIEQRFLDANAPRQHQAPRRQNSAYEHNLDAAE